MYGRGKLPNSRIKSYERGLTIFVLLLAIALATSPINASGQSSQEDFDPESVALLAPVFDSEKESIRNLSTGLSNLYIDREAGLLATGSVSDGLTLDDTGDRVMVMMIMLDETSAQQALDALPGLGAEVIVHYQTWIDAWVPVAMLEQVSTLPGVSLVREPVQVLPVDPVVHAQPLEQDAPTIPFLDPAATTVRTQGVTASRANIWHAAGWTGAGVKVAVIDSFQHYQNAVAAGELPNNIRLFSGLPISYGNYHGTAVAEIIYDMAPGVQFTFASGGSPTRIAWLIEELARQGHKIISSSVGWQGLEPGDGSGPMNNAIQTAYQRYGTLYVQAAGNEAEHHWDGRFRDTNSDRWHEFVPGNMYIWLDGDPLTSEIDPMMPRDYPLKINLRWSSWPVTSNDYDLFLVRWTGSGQAPVRVAWSDIGQTGNQPPTEYIEYKVEQAGWYGIAVQRWRATGNEVLDIYGHWLPNFNINIPDRSLIDAGVSRYALAVGAVDVGSFNLEGYSSRGPTKGPGGVISGGYLKPNISAFANVDTFSYGPGGFYGTSAAQPHVAGAAALVMQAYPDIHPYYIWAHLVGFAQDRGASGADNLYGAGVLRMWDQPPRNIQNSQSPPTQSCVDCAPAASHRMFVPIVTAAERR
jgi:subtilisin family serine protease